MLFWHNAKFYRKKNETLNQHIAKLPQQIQVMQPDLICDFFQGNHFNVLCQNPSSSSKFMKGMVSKKRKFIEEEDTIVLKVGGSPMIQKFLPLTSKDH